jgi:hypothetical protein
VTRSLHDLFDLALCARSVLILVLCTTFFDLPLCERSVLRLVLCTTNGARTLRDVRTLLVLGTRSCEGKLSFAQLSTLSLAVHFARC